MVSLRARGVKRPQAASAQSGDPSRRYDVAEKVSTALGLRETLFNSLQRCAFHETQFCAAVAVSLQPAVTPLVMVKMFRGKGAPTHFMKPGR